MTFKDLKKIISGLRLSSEQSEMTYVLHGKPFWIWDITEHRLEDLRTLGHCCFNHDIGLPVKNGKEYPMFDYEKIIFDAIEQNQNVWIKKARGLGITTFLIRYLVWKILCNTIGR